MTPLLQNTRIPHHRKFGKMYPLIVSHIGCRREAEDDDQEEAHRFQEEEEDEFLQESDDEYSGAEYVDSDDEDTDDKDEYSESSSYLASTEGGPAAEDGEAHTATVTGPAVSPAPEY